MEKKAYKKTLRKLQIELVKFQRHLMKNRQKILIIFEGRDAAGKDGVIKRITQHLSPRETREVALGKPSNYDEQCWYFQRYVTELPAAQEMVIMNRSWYNRAGVERVMGFCTPYDYELFMQAVVPFEQLLVDSGIQILKYYLDIDKAEQAKRLKQRKTDPLLQWKNSPIDNVAQKHWHDYSDARNEMLVRTHHERAPWYIVKADKKKPARLNIIRHMLSCLDQPERNTTLTRFDKKIVIPFKAHLLNEGVIAP